MCVPRKLRARCYQREAENYLKEDLRISLDDFMQMDASVFEAYMKYGKKVTSIRTLLKLLRK